MTLRRTSVNHLKISTRVKASLDRKPSRFLCPICGANSYRGLCSHCIHCCTIFVDHRVRLQRGKPRPRSYAAPQHREQQQRRFPMVSMAVSELTVTPYPTRRVSTASQMPTTISRASDIAVNGVSAQLRPYPKMSVNPERDPRC